MNGMLEYSLGEAEAQKRMHGLPILTCDSVKFKLPVQFVSTCFLKESNKPTFYVHFFVIIYLYPYCEPHIFAIIRFPFKNTRLFFYF